MAKYCIERDSGNYPHRICSYSKKAINKGKFWIGLKVKDSMVEWFDLEVIGDIDLNQIGFQVNQDYVSKEEKQGEEEIYLKEQTREDIHDFETKKKRIEGELDVLNQENEVRSLLHGDCDQIDEFTNICKQDMLTKRTIVAQFDNIIKECDAKLENNQSDLKKCEAEITKNAEEKKPFGNLKIALRGKLTRKEHIQKSILSNGGVECALKDCSHLVCTKTWLKENRQYVPQHTLILSQGWVTKSVEQNRKLIPEEYLVYSIR